MSLTYRNMRDAVFASLWFISCGPSLITSIFYPFFITSCKYGFPSKSTPTTTQFSITHVTSLLLIVVYPTIHSPCQLPSSVVVYVSLLLVNTMQVSMSHCPFPHTNKLMPVENRNCVNHVCWFWTHPINLYSFHIYGGVMLSTCQLVTL